MAVVTGKRGENELEVMTRAKELAAYTLNICKQEKHFTQYLKGVLEYGNYEISCTAHR